MPRPALVLAACACVDLVRDDASAAANVALVAAEAWARGRITTREALDALAARTWDPVVVRRNATNALRCAAQAAYDDVLGAASDASMYAARSIAGKVCLLAPHAERVFVPAYLEAQRRMAAIVREHIPWSTMETAYDELERARRRALRVR